MINPVFDKLKTKQTYQGKEGQNAKCIKVKADLPLVGSLDFLIGERRSI